MNKLNTIIFILIIFLCSISLVSPSSANPDQSSVLLISHVTASPKNPKADQVSQIKIKVKNEGDYDINNIDLEVRLLKDNGNVVQDTGGDDLSDDTEFDLVNGDSQEETFSFGMPIDANNNDEYIVDVQACGYSEFNGSRECDYDNSTIIRVKKENHEVIIDSAIVSPSTINCFGSFDVNAVLKDIGKKDETVKFSISSEELGISKSDTFDLQADDSDNYKKSVNYAFNAPTGLSP